MRRICLSLVMLCLLTQVYADIIQISTTLPQNGKPEYLYSMKNESGYYASSTTSPVNDGDAEIGLFAFYPVDGIENAFYIYSYNAEKWLAYEKAASYSNGKGYVKLSDTQVADSYFRLNNYAEDNYDISPYTTEGNAAEIYLNWYNGCADNIGISLGLWENGGNDDVGSAFTLNEYNFTYKAPEWNDYPIFFTNAVGSWSTGDDTSDRSWISFYGNSTFSLKATVEVDAHATLSFYKESYNDGERIELYIDGIKVRDTGESHRSRHGVKVFEELSPGFHEIEWRVNNCASAFYIYDIGVEQTPCFEVNLAEPGSLGTEILYNVDHLKDVRRIKIKGRMNDDDWAKVKMLENLYFIDLSEAEIDEIPDRTFYNYSGNEFPFLHMVILPEGLERIGDNAFEGSYISHINFPSTLKSIGANAFAYSKLLNAQMNDSITFIGDYAFERCMYLTDVHYPEAITWIPRYCFAECGYIVNFDMHENIYDIYEYAFENNSRCVHRVPKNLRNVFSYAFSDTAIDSLKLPENTFVGDNAFGNCFWLEYAEFPTSYHSVESTSPIYGCPNLKTLVLKSPTVVVGNRKSEFLRDCPADVVIKVPSFLVNSYKLDEYWYNYKIEGFNTGDIKDWTLNSNLVMNVRERFEGKPNLTINHCGSIKLNGDVAQVFDSLYTASYNYYSGTGSDAFARVLVNNDVTTIEGEYNHSYYVKGKYWFFVSLPFDFKVSEVKTNVQNAKFVFRYYDGAARAANGASGNWRNYADDAVITAGTGFIVQASDDCWLTFTALDNESKQNAVSNEEFVKSLAANPSEKASNAGWNLVGNPWQCWYNIHALNFTAPITTYDVYNKKYNAYSIIDDDYAIEPNEAFFVQCPGNINSISFPETGRQLTNEIVNQQSAPSRNVSARDRQLVDILLSCGDINDRTRVVFNDAASMEYETACDASKFFATEGECPQLYSIGGDGTEYAINERPYDNGNVQLGVMFAKGGTYTFSLSRCDAKEVVLFDEVTGVSHNFADGDYTFTAEAGKFTGRFMLGVTKAPETTSVAELESAGITVATVDGAIEVSGAAGSVTVVAADGRIVAEFIGERTVSVAPGVYIVRTDVGAVKVVVKK